jgi:hypothetical protein
MDRLKVLTRLLLEVRQKNFTWKEIRDPAAPGMQTQSSPKRPKV